MSKYINLGKAFRVFSTLELLVFSIVTLALHWTHVNVKTPCTDFDTPHNCWNPDEKGGGIFRAMNFTALSTYISLNPYSEATMQNMGNTAYMYHIEPDSESVLENYTYAKCDSYTANSRRWHACKATKIPQLYEIATLGDAYRSDWRWSGGVDIWFFFWLALWIATSFQVLFFPVDIVRHPNASQKIKQLVLLIWHTTGVSLIISFYANDDYFNFRLPLNNVFLGMILELSVVLTQVYLLKMKVDTEKTESNLLVDSEYETVGTNRKQQNNNGVGLSTLMRVSAPAHGPFFIGEGDDGAAIKPSSLLQLGSTVDVFGSRVHSDQAMELFFLECVFTLPITFIAITCIFSRVSETFALEMFYFRLVLIFLGMMISFKAISHHWYDDPDKKEGNTDKQAWNKAKDWHVPVAIMAFAFVFGLLSISTFFDFVDMGANTQSYWGEALGHHIWQLWYLGAIVYAMVVFAPLLWLILWVSLGSMVTRSKYGMNAGFTQWTSKQQQLMAYYFLSFLVLLLRTWTVVFMLSPNLWYGDYDKKDVLLNYGIDM